MINGRYLFKQCLIIEKVAKPSRDPEPPRLYHAYMQPRPTMASSRLLRILTTDHFPSGSPHIRAATCTWTASSQSIFRKELEAIKNAGTWKTERIISSPQAASIKLEGRKDSVLNFCANNYLGLSSHPEVIEAGREALRDYGAGLSSVRFICGTQVELRLHHNETLSLS
jgi:hypothetical protein